MNGRSSFINHMHSQHVRLFAMKMIQSDITLNQLYNRMRIPIEKQSVVAITFTFRQGLSAKCSIRMHAKSPLILSLNISGRQ